MLALWPCLCRLYLTYVLYIYIYIYISIYTSGCLVLELFSYPYSPPFGSNLSSAEVRARLARHEPPPILTTFYNYSNVKDLNFSNLTNSRQNQHQIDELNASGHGGSSAASVGSGYNQTPNNALGSIGNIGSSVASLYTGALNRRRKAK